MPRTLDPFRLLRFAVAGWMNHEQQQILDYLREENRILHVQLVMRTMRAAKSVVVPQNLQRPGKRFGLDCRTDKIFTKNLQRC
jgi:hypothetical protein